ncbi:MAG: tetratricopeptide repeat protein [Desulfobulbaceae bacterium]|nr:tetratricopeptide repeat protein [Desulfobulbaceae bacterium]
MPRPLAIPLSLVALICLVFWPVLGFDFLTYDDGFTIYNNWRVTNFSDENLLYFWRGPYDSLYIPITYNLWALVARLAALFSAGEGWGATPIYFHAANLLTHTASSLVVMVILRALGAGGWAAWGGALFFALHPVQEEAIAWVTGMKDLLSGFFSLLAIWQYTVYSQAAAAEGRGRSLPYGLTALCFVLALLSKPGAVITPLILLIIGRLLQDRGWRQLGVELLPLTMLAVPVVIITKYAQPGSSHAWQPDLWQRLLVKGDAIFFYLTKIVLPYSLGPDYGRSPQVVLNSGPGIYLTALLPLLVLGVIWRWGGKKGLSAALIFLAALLPVSGLLLFDFQSISTVADRYLYLAMLGPALAIGWGLTRYQSKSVWFIFLTVLTLLTGKAFSQVWVWENSTTLSTHAVQLNPKSWVAHNNLGIAKADLGLDQEAIAAFSAALDANPRYAEAHNNLGALYHRQGRQQEATGHLKKALTLNPASHKSAFLLADIHSDQADYEEAITFYQQALAAKPDFIEAYNNLGLLLLNLKRPEEALALYQLGIKSCPDHPMLYFNLARTQAELGNTRAAIAALLQATAIDPEFAPAYHMLSRAYRDMQDEKTALKYAAKAKELGFAK